MEEFNYYKWEEEVFNLAKDLNRWWCWGKKEKKKRLEFLAKQGSQYLEHAAKRFIPDKTKMKEMLVIAEVALK